jgi:hypothetical protein
MAVFGVFALLYWHAYRRRSQLELNQLEEFDTRTDIRESLLNVAIAVVSVTIALLGRAKYAGFSGMTYMLTPFVMTVHGKMTGRRRKRLETKLGFGEQAVLEST